MAQEQKGRGRPKFHWWLAEQCYVLVDEVERQNLSLIHISEPTRRS